MAPSHVVGAVLATLAGRVAQDAPWGMPPGCSTIAPEVDRLYNFIFIITAITFVGVEAILLWFCIRYRRRPGGRSSPSHGSRVAEVIWTVSPAVVLILIAVSQMSAWADAKIHAPGPNQPGVRVIQVMGERFDWTFRYPGADGKFDKPEDLTDETDDVVLRKTLIMPLGDTALVPLRSVDVIHSFSVFAMRVKQDVVPGLRNRVWFTPTGFWVAPVDTSSAWVSAEKVFEPVSSNPWTDGTFVFVRNMEEYAARFGSKAVAITDFNFSAGRFRPFTVDGTCTIFRNGQVSEKVPVKEAEFAMVPYEIACMELCGANHFTMTAKLWVLPPAVFEHWYAQEMKKRETWGLANEFLRVWKRWKD